MNNPCYIKVFEKSAENDSLHYYDELVFNVVQSSLSQEYYTLTLRIYTGKEVIVKTSDNTAPFIYNGNSYTELVLSPGSKTITLTNKNHNIIVIGKHNLMSMSVGGDTSNNVKSIMCDISQINYSYFNVLYTSNISFHGNLDFKSNSAHNIKYFTLGTPFLGQTALSERAIINIDGFKDASNLELYNKFGNNIGNIENLTRCIKLKELYMPSNTTQAVEGELKVLIEALCSTKAQGDTLIVRVQQTNIKFNGNYIRDISQNILITFDGSGGCTVVDKQHSNTVLGTYNGSSWTYPS